VVVGDGCDKRSLAQGFKNCWEIWSELNARIFNSTEAPSFTVAEKIKGEASAWILAGAKHLACLISGA